MTLEELVDSLRGVDGPVKLDEMQVRELVAWFDTARNTVSIAEHRRARIDELSQANLRLEEDAAKAVGAEREACASLVTDGRTWVSSAEIAAAIRTRGGL